MPSGKHTHGSSDSASDNAWRADVRLGLRKLAEGDFAQALALFEHAHRLAPTQPEVSFALGRERLRRGLTDEAEVLLRAAWTADPSLIAAGAALARLVGVVLHRVDDGKRIVEEALVGHPQEAALHVVLGEILLCDAQPDLACKALERARECAADSANVLGAVTTGLARAHNLIGIERERSGHAEESLFAFKRAADLDPEWSAPIVNMGAAFEKLGRNARARSCYERALGRDAENPVALFNLAQLFKRSGDVGRAEPLLRELLALEPLYPDAHRALAEILLASGRFAEASGVCQDWVTRFPRDPGSWYALGIVHNRLEDPSAESDLRTALDRDPSHVGACIELASLLTRQGHYVEAAQIARRAHELDPERASALLEGEINAT